MKLIEKTRASTVGYSDVKGYRGVNHFKQINHFYDVLDIGKMDILAEDVLKTQEMICAIYDRAKTKNV